MFDLTLIKDLTEIISKSLTFPDIEVLGRYFFKDYSTHKLEKVSDRVTISPFTASNRVVSECQNKNKLEELFAFVIELDGNPLNGKNIHLIGLENLLYRLSKTGIYYDFNSRKFSNYNSENKTLLNWGALKESKEYPIIIASIDICRNSELVNKYKTAVMEKVYYKLWDFLKNKTMNYKGRIWSWAGDGGLLAFRKDDGIANAVACCMEIQFTLPVFNALPDKGIDDALMLRIGLDMGDIKFFNDTGRIVSDVINYAAHLEKKGTEANGLSVSESIFISLPKPMQRLFQKKIMFEGKIAYTLTYQFPRVAVNTPAVSKT